MLYQLSYSRLPGNASAPGNARERYVKDGGNGPYRLAGYKSIQ